MATRASTAVAEKQSVTGADHAQYLTFVLGQQTLALAILGIREIIQYTAPTDVPMVPSHIRGVINLRGAVVPVVDLAARFGRPPAPITKRTCIVVVELDMRGERQTLGVVVDAVTEVIEIPGAEIEAPPSFGGTIRTEFIAGLGKVEGRFVIILDADRVFDVDEIRVVAEASDAA